jgi:hypothetical protein
VWWVLLMSFWVVLDDSIAVDELLAGAGAAALAATLAEFASYQSGLRLRLRSEWVAPALRLPGQILRDTWTVFAALWRLLAHGEQPPSAFAGEPVRYGGQSAEATTRRFLLIGGRSVAPNSFVLGLDAESGLMVVHQLVARAGKAQR